MARESDTNPYLQGNFAPWRSEDEHAELRVRGEIPRGLEGTYYRNGPNPAFEPKGRYHWFDGDGMVHAIALRDGRASYRNRYVASDGLRAERAAGEALYGGLLDFDGQIREGAPPFKNTGNTNIVFHAGKLLALMEAALPTQMHPRTLETLGAYDFGGRLGTPMTAHPKFDPDSGEMLFFGYAPFPPYLTYHVAARDGSLVRSEPIDLAWPTMMHDFAITREHVIFILCPIVFSFDLVAAKGTPFNWEPERGAKLGVMPRRGGNADVRWFDIDPCFVFHPMNAYDDGERIVLDVCRFEELRFLEPNPPADAALRPLPHRWTIDLRAGSVAAQTLDDHAGEFPRIDERRLGRQHRYGYVAGAGPADDGAPTFNAIYKYDLETGRRETHTVPAGGGVGEAVFVPAHADAAEDEGYVLFLAYDAQRNGSDLVILDARHVAGAPLARVEIPHRVPYGFHGNWVAA